jgi:isoleucyl-tRNA synthetase
VHRLVEAAEGGDRARREGRCDDQAIRYAAFDAADMSDANYDRIDMHRPYVDHIVLVSPSGKPMTARPTSSTCGSTAAPCLTRSGTTPSRTKATFKEKFPAAFIAEGVDQTRGWFYTLHAISTLTQIRWPTRPW